MNRGKGYYLAMGAVIAVILLVCIGSAIYVRPDRAVSFSFGFGGKAELRNEQEFDIAGIEKIEIKYSSPNIELYKGEGNKIVIKEYLSDNHKDALGEMEVKNGTLSCRQGKTRRVIFGFMIGDERAEIYVPEKYAGIIELQTSSGNISTEEEWKAEEFEATASSGNIEITSVIANTIKASASSGNIYFEKAEGNRIMSASSGNLEVNSGKGSGDFTTSSGNLTVNHIDGETQAVSSSGNIKLESDVLNGDIKIKTSSGDIRAAVPKESAFSFEGDCSSGRIKTSFDNALKFNKNGNHAEGNYGSQPKTKITAKASSGNITVSFGEN